ncbi:MAG: helix-turn-helix transcriptional regulator [Cellulosilyticum sp.]|nr:helix-turn-helix transcriptional regulator [Cellulosilyticum sp.]
MEYINGYTFVNFNTGWVISNRGTFLYNEVKNKGEVETLIEFQEEDLTRCFWLDYIKEESKKKKVREEIDLDGVSLVLKLPTIKKDPYALAIININTDRLKRLVESEIGEEKVIILNDDGKVIYTNDDQMAEYCIQHQEEIINQTFNHKQLKKSDQYIISNAYSDTINWNYIVGYDVNMIKEGASDILKLVFYLLAMILVGGGSAIIFARRIYNPVSKLTQYVEGILDVNSTEIEEKVAKEDNEFEYLTTSIGNLVDKKTSLEGLIVNQQSQLTELFQLRLIRGDIRVDQLEIYMKQLSIEKKKYYIIMSVDLMLIKQENDMEIMQNVMQDALQDAMRIDVVENLPKDISSQLMMHPVCNHRAISVLLTEDNKEALEEKSLKFFKQLEKYTRESYSYIICAGVSSIFEEMIEYRKAYNQSIEALKSCRVLNKGEDNKTSDCIFYSDITNDKHNYIYDIVIEKEIKTAVDKGEQAEACEIVDRFINELIAKKVAHHECYLYLHRFLVAILTVVTDAGVSINEIIKDTEDNIFLGFNQLYDFEKIRAFYKHKLIIPVIEGLNSFRESKSSEIIDLIEKLVHERKGDISLTECADELHYHPTYIWKIMKLEKDITFTDYIAEYKLQQAKKLLLETNMTIADIAKELNYTNTQNFIRFFSKLEGTTPGKYRKQQEE